MDDAAREVGRYIADAINSSSFDSLSYVVSAIDSLNRPHFEDERLVFNFATSQAPEWNKPGMVAGVVQARTASSFQKRVTFILREGGREVHFDTFAARCRREQKYWARRAGCADGTSWESIINRLRARHQNGRLRDENRTICCFQASQIYNMS